MSVKQMAWCFAQVDVLTVDAHGKSNGISATTKVDTSSPRDFHPRPINAGHQINMKAFPSNGALRVRTPAPLGQVSQTMSTDAQTNLKQERPLPSLPSLTISPPASTTATPSESSCSPRSPPPTPIPLGKSNGCTLLTTAELKQRIHQSRSDDDVTLTQVPTDSREPLPPTPTSPFVNMGNKPSIVSGSPAPDDRSQHSVVRNTKPVSRKGSYNVFKRVDSRSPLPRDVTASVMSILHRDGQKRDEDADYDDDDNPLDRALTQNPYVRPERKDSRYPPDLARSKMHSTSTTTMTEEKAGQPLSASTTIRDFRTAGQSAVDDSQLDGADDDDVTASMAYLHSTSLSPTIPAPSPLPEDSPHKYGLRDKMDTPELPEPAKEISLPKARRKSSGLEIFNEAKTLQSAASFLNGLSTSRRRAESAAADYTTDTSNSGFISRPSSARPPSAHYSGQYPDGEGRRRGHNFKSSGFAYTRPLTLAQIKCYSGHSRLLLSRNKHAPVECAVCHIDDDGEHFSCSWCAIRMCKYCRKDFAQRGLTALRERIKTAEMGGADSCRVSDESLASAYERGGHTLAS